MCIIIYTPNGRIPKKHLSESLDNNRDGWGLMWPENGKVQISTGLYKQEFYKLWKWAGKYDCPKVFHARIGTHGKDSLDNCHPFMIPGHGELAMAHNGIIGRCAGDATDDVSDTRHFIERIVANMPVGFLDNNAIKELLTEYIGYSKLVFMDGDGNVNIIRSKLGEWLEGRWYSNSSYLSRQSSYSGHSNGCNTGYYIPENNHETKLLGFHKDDTVEQANFPVFKEDEIAVAKAASQQAFNDALHAALADGIISSDDYAEYIEDYKENKDWDTLTEAEWQERVENRHEAASCGIGVPSCVLANTPDDEAARKLIIDGIRERIKKKFPEDNAGAIEWRVQKSGDYPTLVRANLQEREQLKIPDPRDKYAAYFDQV